MNKEQQELLDKAYRKYADSHQYFVNGWLHVIPMLHSNETFINKCKTDTGFSKKWGLKIEERELDMMERWAIADLTPNMEEFDFANYMCDKHNVPTKLITITYNNETIESYE